MSGSAELSVLQAHREIDRPMTAAEIRAGVNLIQDVMRSVMIDGVHFGTIPGTKKPTLYKPGAEKILSTFRIATEPRPVEDLSTADEIRYRVTVAASAQVSGVFLGAAIGECSSDEEKYKWRRPVCKEEFAETPEDRRRQVWKHGKDGAYRQAQVRTAPADVANTVLKMAHKRALIAVTLVVTAASDIFAQDIEDLPEEIRRDVAADEGAAIGSEPKAAAAEPPPPAAGTKTTAASENLPPGIRVTSARVAKTGKNKDGKGEWTLYVIGLSDGNEYSTFSESIYTAAKQFVIDRGSVTFEFEEKDGKRNLILLEAVR